MEVQLPEYGMIVTYINGEKEKEAAKSVLKRNFETTKKLHPEYGLTNYELRETPPFMYHTEIDGESVDVEMGEMGWYAKVED